MDKVLILLATYNGEKFIKEQLNSIFSQTYKYFDLVVSDDNSTDETLKILEEFSVNYKNITIIQNLGKHGALHNFKNLVKYAKEQLTKYDYYMFCDQDDVWIHDKIECSLEEIKKYQKKPVLVYTSKQYVDEYLNPLNWNVKKESLFDKNILLQNKTYGCTHILSYELFEKLDYNIDDNFINYDHYVAIQAFLYGEVHFLDKKTILYRQHGNNVSGVVNGRLINRLGIRKKYIKVWELFNFLIDYCYTNSESLDERNRSFVYKLYKLKGNHFSFIYECVKNGVTMNTVLGTLQFYIFLFLNIKNNKD